MLEKNQQIYLIKKDISKSQNGNDVNIVHDVKYTVKIVFYFSELCKLHCLFTKICGKLCVFVILGAINYVLRTLYY